MKIGNLVGDYEKVWCNRYVVFRDTHIACYLYQNSAEPQGCFFKDNSFTLGIHHTYDRFVEFIIPGIPFLFIFVN